MKDNKFSAWLSTFIFCFLFWLLLTWSVALREVLIGLGVSAVVAAVSARFLIQKDAFYLYHPMRLLTLIFYLVITGFIGADSGYCCISAYESKRGTGCTCGSYNQKMSIL